VPLSQALGDLVTYSITVAHTGASTANAYDVVLADTLPAFIACTVVWTLGEIGVSGHAPAIDLITASPHDSKAKPHKAKSRPERAE